MVKLRLPRRLIMAGESSDSSMVDFLNFRPRKARTPSPPPPPTPVFLGVSSCDRNKDRSQPILMGSEASVEPDHILSGSADDDDHDSRNSKRTLEGTENIGSSGKIQKTYHSPEIRETDDDDDDEISKTSSTEGLILCSSSSDDTYIKNQLVSSVAPNKRSYACSVCAKTFSSHLALGGHKSSHTKFKMIICDAVDLRPRHKQISITNTSCDHPRAAATRRQPLLIGERTHICKICFEKFPSGQALGGHQRRHWKPPKILDFDLNESPKEEEDDDDDDDPSANC